MKEMLFKMDGWMRKKDRKKQLVKKNKKFLYEE